MFLWQWISKGALASQLGQLGKLQGYNSQLQTLSGIGALGSSHFHADVKVYINGNAIDFSQRKYQLASSFIHFEERIGDVIHTHATGLTVGHMLRSLGINFGNSCIAAEGKTYCSNSQGTLKFYVNGKPNSEFGDYVIKNLDRIMVSYGSETEDQVQKQLDSVTSLAPRYSIGG